MNGPSSGFWKSGFFVLLAGCAFLAGARFGAGDRALAQSTGESVPGGNRSAGGGTADSDGHMIAVTGTSSSGAAVLYLVDTKLKRLAIYQATGKNIELVAARNIEYDLKLDSYHDGSPEEVAVPRLRAEFIRRQGGKPGDDAGKNDGNK